jgi:hypothetical protein
MSDHADMAIALVLLLVFVGVGLLSVIAGTDSRIDEVARRRRYLT